MRIHATVRLTNSKALLLAKKSCTLTLQSGLSLRFPLHCEGVHMKQFHVSVSLSFSNVPSSIRMFRQSLQKHLEVAPNIQSGVEKINHVTQNSGKLFSFYRFFLLEKYGFFFWKTATIYHYIDLDHKTFSGNGKASE